MSNINKVGTIKANLKQKLSVQDNLGAKKRWKSSPEFGILTKNIATNSCKYKKIQM